MIYDAIIIGGGVSGLAAAYYLTQKKQRVLVLERGKHIYDRCRDDLYDIANGVGGAGLFSDGKVSFYPSASQLWQLRANGIREAYTYLQGFLHEQYIEIEDFSSQWLEEQEQEGIRKRYKSQTLNIEQRLKIIFKLCQFVGNANILVGSDVKSIVKSNGSYHLTVNQNDNKLLLHASTIIIAGGKHIYAKLLPFMTGINTDSKKRFVEVGIRIECRNEDFDYYDDEQTDVKLIDNRDDYLSVRTFCCCRDGVVVESSSYGMISLNGSADDKGRRGFTNIGILLRYDGIKNQRASNKVLNALEKIKESQRLSMSAYMEGKEAILGADADSIIRNFLSSHFPKMSLSDATIYHPSIEKAGVFPTLSDTLQMKSENIWVAGDATGMFRGILSSFVSGFLVASCVTRILSAYDSDLQQKFHIKVSSSEKRKVVFTAQSKQFFYCRNAVCEYVMKQGCIPVNPFRIFGYFLDDRVDRNIVRNGNNEMISRCDELWVFGPISDGVLFEIYYSRKLGLPVRFFSIETRASEIVELRDEDLKFESEVHNFQLKKSDLQTLAGNNFEIPSSLQLELQWDE